MEVGKDNGKGRENWKERGKEIGVEEIKRGWRGRGEKSEERR